MASSKSLPGVRMVTATLTGSWAGPPARISMGSSAARRSARSNGSAARTAVTRVDETLRRMGTAGSI